MWPSVTLGGTGGGDAGRREQPGRGPEGLQPGRDLLLLALFLWAWGFHFSSTTAGGDRDWLEVMLVSLSAGGIEGTVRYPEVQEACGLTDGNSSGRVRASVPSGTEAWSEGPAPPYAAVIGLRGLVFIIWKNEDGHTDGTRLLEGLIRGNTGKGRSTGPGEE